ncbi:MAG: endonuclease/exonuclease/phosphatase family protein [Pseudomonadota bacterium]
MTTLIYIGAIILIAVNTASWLGRWDWRFDLISHFRPHLAIGSILFALVALLFVRYSASAIGFGLFVVQCYLLITVIPAPIATAAGSTLKVMTINVLNDNDRHHDLVSLVEREQPDLLALQEMDWTWAETARTLAKLFPFSTVPDHRHPPRNQIFSRFPIIENRMERSPAVDKRSGPTTALFTTLDIDGTPVEFINMHPSHPMSDRLWRWRNAYLNWISETLAMRPDNRPAIVVGDWNLSPWSPFYSEFMEKTGLRDAAALSYAEPTRHPRGFPELFLLGVTIDHIAVSPDIAVLSSDVGPEMGSDHRPVCATLRLP